MIGPMSLTPASEHELEARRQLAASVVEALATTGLPVHIAGTTTRQAPGAEVEIDRFADQAGGVFVGWNTSNELVALFEEPLLAEDFEHPAIRLHGAIADAMARALQAILAASGYRVEAAADEYRPFTLRVLSR